MAKTRLTATKMDETVIALLGGHSFEGNKITNDQYKALYKFYGFDSEHSGRQAQGSVESSQARYEKEMVEYEGSTSYCKPTQPDLQKIMSESKRLYDAGDERDIMRCVSHDGRRVMAFLSRYLQRGEDPVRLIGEALLELGYDVCMGDLWEDDRY